MFLAFALYQITGRIALGVFDVPGLYHFAIKLIDNQLKVFIRSNKHVVGAVENNAVFVDEQYLVQLGAARSGIDVGDKAGIRFP